MKTYLKGNQDGLEKSFQIWTEQVKKSSVSTDPLFTEIWVHDPKYPTGRDNVLSRVFGKK